MKKQKVDLDAIFHQLLPTTGAPPPVVPTGGYLSAVEATALFQSIVGITWDKLHNRYGLELKRKTKTYIEGDPQAATNYMNAYGDKGSVPIPFTQAPPELQVLRKRLQDDNPDLPLSVCYINYYFGGGAAISWHSDREERGCAHPVLMATVYGAGAGKTRPFCLLKMDGRVGVAAWSVPTNHGDLILMPPGFHDNYLRGILREKEFCLPRISLTFRNPDLSPGSTWFYYKAEPQVWDCHAGKVYPPDAVYIGCKVRDHKGGVIRQGSVFGNGAAPLKSHRSPVAHNEADFRAYALKRMQDPAFAKEVETLRGKHLLCWCVQAGPKRAPFCHARVWLELANPKEPQQKDWRLVEGFLSKTQSDDLYKRMLSLDWQSHPNDGPGAFCTYFGKSYDKQTANPQNKRGGREGEISKIPAFLQTLADRVSKETQTPVNYVQCHKFAPNVPVRPHHDPAGTVVPMLTLGQERTFRVGGKHSGRWAQGQIDRDVKWHVPAEELLLKQGDLLVFEGGRVMHSMFPADQDANFNRNESDWRISILFRWTTDVMREHGPGVKGVEYKKPYDADVQKWREEQFDKSVKWDKPPKGVYFPGFLTPAETQALFDTYLKLRRPEGDKASRLNFEHFNDTGKARNNKLPQELPQGSPSISAAPKPVRSLVAKLSKRFKRTVNYVSAVGYEDQTHYMDYHQHQEDYGHDTPVFIVSNGAARSFGIRRKGQPDTEIRFKAEPGSLIVLPNSYNTTHEHAVLKDKVPRGMRIALNMKAVDEGY